MSEGAMGSSWDARRVRALRRHLRFTQQGLARELGMRQQTISEWEQGLYRPRGGSVTLLNRLAERAAFGYDAFGDQPSAISRQERDGSDLPQPLLGKEGAGGPDG